MGFLDTCAGTDVTECPNQVELDLEADSGPPTGEDLREDGTEGVPGSADNLHTTFVSVEQHD